MKLKSTKDSVSLHMIKEKLWEIMIKEIENNGYRDHTLALEHICHNISEVIEVNNIEK